MEKLITAVGYTVLFTCVEGRGMVCFGDRGSCIQTAVEVQSVTAAK